MAILEFRNAYYRGWFAARARRPAPEPDMIEEHFFIDMGFTDGKLSSGRPLESWCKSIAPGMPANLDMEIRPDKVVFTTRRPQEPKPPAPERAQPPEPPELTDAVESAEPGGETLLAEEGTAEEDGEEEEKPARLPEKKPSYRLPSRAAYGGGIKRRAQFKRG
ncbi:MAG TPA: hypothetical protein VHB46_02930 [Burkholderiales bacterium]|nr:hypothetical protein [Burkholderiales bacterium]